MSLAEDLAVQPTRVNAKERCGFAEKVDAIESDADRKAVRAAADNPRWSARALAGVLARYEIVVSFTAVAAHRRGDCPCARKATA